VWGVLIINFGLTDSSVFKVLKGFPYSSQEFCTTFRKSFSNIQREYCIVFAQFYAVLLRGTYGRFESFLQHDGGYPSETEETSSGGSLVHLSTPVTHTTVVFGNVPPVKFTHVTDDRVVGNFRTKQSAHTTPLIRTQVSCP
jgi:hypothetical protein